MHKENIVLKKTGAQLPLWKQPEGFITTFKDRQGTPRGTPRGTPHPLFSEGGAIFRNPQPLLCIKIVYFGIPIFPTAQTGRKKEKNPNNE